MSSIFIYIPVAGTITHHHQHQFSIRSINNCDPCVCSWSRRHGPARFVLAPPAGREKKVVATRYGRTVRGWVRDTRSRRGRRRPAGACFLLALAGVCVLSVRRTPRTAKPSAGTSPSPARPQAAGAHALALRRRAGTTHQESPGLVHTPAQTCAPFSQG